MTIFAWVSLARFLQNESKDTVPLIGFIEQEAIAYASALQPVALPPQDPPVAPTATEVPPKPVEQPPVLAANTECDAEPQEGKTWYRDRYRHRQVSNSCEIDRKQLFDKHEFERLVRKFLSNYRTELR